MSIIVKLTLSQKYDYSKNVVVLLVATIQPLAFNYIDDLEKYKTTLLCNTVASQAEYQNKFDSHKLRIFLVVGFQ